jgi:hypothetical protein
MKVPKKHIDLFQRYLTKEEAEEIIPLFKKNYNEYFAIEAKGIVKNGPESLQYAFHWEKTPEKHDYWEKIYKFICERFNSESTEF